MLYKSKTTIVVDNIQLQLYIVVIMNKQIEKAAKICGSQVALAKAVGKTQRHVWNWIHRDKKIPAEYVIPIEKATNGQVSRHELRPDIYPPEEQHKSS